MKDWIARLPNRCSMNSEMQIHKFLKHIVYATMYGVFCLQDSNMRSPEGEARGRRHLRSFASQQAGRNKTLVTVVRSAEEL